MALNTVGMRIGMRVVHPRYGVGTVKALTENTSDISFDDGLRSIAPDSSELESAEATAAISGSALPLTTIIRETVHATVDALGLEKRDSVTEGLANRWNKGVLILQPRDASLQSKELPLETFFHKVVLIRNQLRVLEQKVNANDKLTDADKFELQQYVTRCYGSLTSFNILFKNKEDQFSAS